MTETGELDEASKPSGHQDDSEVHVCPRGRHPRARSHLGYLKPMKVRRFQLGREESCDISTWMHFCADMMAGEL